jgi:hypothetical protein
LWEFCPVLVKCILCFNVLYCICTVNILFPCPYTAQCHRQVIGVFCIASIVLYCTVQTFHVVSYSKYSKVILCVVYALCTLVCPITRCDVRVACVFSPRAAGTFPVSWHPAVTSLLSAFIRLESPPPPPLQNFFLLRPLFAFASENGKVIKEIQPSLED